MRKEKHAPPFFAPFSGLAQNGKQFGCGHTPKFLQAAGPQKCLLGSSARENACWGAPQTRWTSGQIVPKSRRKRLLDAAQANAPGPYFPARPYGRADNQC